MERDPVGEEAVRILEQVVRYRRPLVSQAVALKEFHAYGPAVPSEQHYEDDELLAVFHDILNQLDYVVDGTDLTVTLMGWDHRLYNGGWLTSEDIVRMGERLLELVYEAKEAEL